jgi:hypothetical protein
MIGFKNMDKFDFFFIIEGDNMAFSSAIAPKMNFNNKILYFEPILGIII